LSKIGSESNISEILKGDVCSNKILDLIKNGTPKEQITENWSQEVCNMTKNTKDETSFKKLLDHMSEQLVKGFVSSAKNDLTESLSKTQVYEELIKIKKELKNHEQIKLEFLEKQNSDLSKKCLIAENQCREYQNHIVKTEN